MSHAGLAEAAMGPMVDGPWNSFDVWTDPTHHRELVRRA